MRQGRRWTLIVVREGEVRSRRWRLSQGRLTSMALAATGVLAVAFFLIGRWAGDVRSRGRIETLEEEILDLRTENVALGAVVDRVGRVEEQYRRLRSVMGGEVAASGRDILLPPLPERDADEQSERDEDGSFVWPLVETGFVTRSFGDTASAPFGGHIGVDIAVPAGSYVRSVRGGTVVEAGKHVEYGLYVKIAHDDALSTLYAHNAWLFVVIGDTVETGEVIALSGNSGRSTAPHLHVELEREGVPVDPLAYLSEGT